jgi:phosphoserine phosphatase
MDGTILNGDLGETVFFLLHGQSLKEEYPNIEWPDIDIHTLSPQNNPDETIHQYLSFTSSGAFSDAFKLTAQVIGNYPSEEIQIFAKQILNINSSFTTHTFELTELDDRVAEYVIHIGSQIRSEMAQLIHQLKDRGARVWIVSASPQPVVEACGDMLGIPRNRIFGATSNEDNSKLTRFPWKEDKVTALQDAGVSKPLIVFGNGLEDLNMLEIAVKPVVVADAHEPLLQLAKERKWDIFGENTIIEWE